MNGRGEKRAGAGREKSPSFIRKKKREMNQTILRANNRYIYLENRWERLHILENQSFSTLNLRQ